MKVSYDVEVTGQGRIGNEPEVGLIRGWGFQRTIDGTITPVRHWKGLKRFRVPSRGNRLYLLGFPSPLGSASIFRHLWQRCTPAAAIYPTPARYTWTDRRGRSARAVAIAITHAHHRKARALTGE